MKKAMILASYFVVGSVFGQNDVVIVDQGAVYDKTMTQATLEVALASAYVWRGQVINNDPVIQPQITLSQYGFSANIWANYDIGQNMTGVQYDASEFDFALAYSLPVDVNQMAFDIGLINYNFPANGSYDGSGKTEGVESTTEAFISATVLSFESFVPSLTFYGDIHNVDQGAYAVFDIYFPYEVSQFVNISTGYSAGWGNTKYNDHYWTASGSGDFDGDWSDHNFYFTASYEVYEGLTAATTLNYVVLNGDSFRNGAMAAGYENDEKAWLSFNLAYDF